MRRLEVECENANGDGPGATENGVGSDGPIGPRGGRDCDAQIKMETELADGKVAFIPLGRLGLRSGCTKGRDMPTKRSQGLILFSWGYAGWGNSVPQLLAATEAVEAGRGFRPPDFVDVRFSRSVRAPGFRDKAFERVLGPDRYHWMPSLGNAAIGTRGPVRLRIQDPTAASDLIDVAQRAHKQNRACHLLLLLCPVPGRLPSARGRPLGRGEGEGARPGVDRCGLAWRRTRA